MRKQFWIDTMERAIKTAAQTAAVAIGTSTVLEAIAWQTVISMVLTASILSVLCSIGSMKITGDCDSASLVKKDKGGK